MNIPYRTQKRIKQILLIILAVILVAAVALACWTVWLQRFVVYTREEGAVFRFDVDTEFSGAQLAVEPEQQTVPIYYNEGDNAITSTQELTKVVGYYIDEKALKGDMNAIRDQIRALKKGTPVMIDVKNIYGSFFYDSKVNGQRANGIDPAAMESLLEFLDQSGMYTIARFPALRDYYYGLNNVPDGVPHSSGGYLYQDGDGCYWLNPDSTGTLKFIVDIIQEVKAFGFDEVLLSDFAFPKTDSILYKGDKAEALNSAAATLLKTCGTSSFCVSFAGDGSWVLPEGRTRLYLENVEAAQVEKTAEAAVQNCALADPDVNLVFVTDVHDTRFDVYGVLRPLEAAH